MKKLLAPFALGMVLLVGCSAPIEPAHVPAPQKFVDVTGSVRLPANTNQGVYQIVNDPDGTKSSRCYPMERSGYRDLHAGGTAKIISSRGDEIDGEIEVGDWDGTHCSMRISFKNVPDGFDSYSLFLGHRSEHKVTDISAPLELSMGD